MSQPIQFDDDLLKEGTVKGIDNNDDVNNKNKNNNNENNNNNNKKSDNEVTNIEKFKQIATQMKDKAKNNFHQFAEASKNRLSIEGQLSQALISLQKYINPKFLNASIPEDTLIPRWVLKKAKGIVFLTVIKGGFIFAGNIGTGVVIVRNKNQKSGWTGPSSVMMAGVSFGLLAGASKVDYILILTDDKAVKQFTGNGQLRIGGELQVALGPIGRQGHASIGAGDKGVSFILSYSHSKGLYGGLELDGQLLNVRADCNREYYQQNVTCEEILTGKIDPPQNEDYETIIHLMDSYCQENLMNQGETATIEELENDKKNNEINLGSSHYINNPNVNGNNNSNENNINANENNNNNDNFAQFKLSLNKMGNKIENGFNKMVQTISQKNIFSNNNENNDNNNANNNNNNNIYNNNSINNSSNDNNVNPN